ncbi:MAG: reverse transcriptase family protein [Saprospiraceae bacterium]
MTRQKILRRIQEFLAIRNTTHLTQVLDVTAHALTLQSGYKKYNEFTIPKPSGGLRYIESPSPGLKDIQRKLNRFLQAVYFQRRTKAAYGFIIDVKNTSDRNIITNARQHLNAPYLVNMDFKDFFHQITKPKVHQIFRKQPFFFSKEISKILTDVCCYKGRLPMGAPTSPVLTNIYCIPLDRQISDFADGLGIRYTRYADDMSFSGNISIDKDFRDTVGNIAMQYGLSLHPGKTKIFGPNDIKKVTGILVSDRLYLPPELLEDTRVEIKRLRNIIEVGNNYGAKHADWVKHYKLKINGYLQFSKQVIGKSDPLIISLQHEYNQALNPPKVTDPISWRELPYQF